MTSRATIWFLLAGSAVGLAIAGTLWVSRRQRRLSASSLMQPAEPRQEAKAKRKPRPGSKSTEGSKAAPKSLRSREPARARAAPASGRVSSTLSADAAGTRQAGPRRRHEPRSLVLPRPLDRDPDAAQGALVGIEALEVPIGHSADPNIDSELSHEPTEQMFAGAPPLGRREFPGMLEQKNPTLDERELTAQPIEELLPPEQAYDAVAPDELGREFLARATETGSGGYDSEREVELAEVFVNAGMSVMSEGSFLASQPEEVEAAVDADMNSQDHDRDLPQVTGTESNGSRPSATRTTVESRVASTPDVSTARTRRTARNGRGPR